MTVVNATRNGNEYALTAKGHATGSPVVCAAVSGLLYALAGYLKNAEKAGRVETEMLRIEEAFVEIRCKGSRDAWEMAVIGLLQIEQQYPQFLSVSVEIF